jgi:hypothetical protein
MPTAARPYAGWVTVAVTFQPVHGINTSKLHLELRAEVEARLGQHQVGSTCYQVPGLVLPPPNTFRYCTYCGTPHAPEALDETATCEECWEGTR